MAHLEATLSTTPSLRLPTAPARSMSFTDGCPGIRLSEDLGHAPTKFVLKRFLKAHDGDVEKAQSALEHALSWHLRMRHLTRNGDRQAGATLNLAWVTTSQGTVPQTSPPNVVIWHIWGVAKSKEIFDKKDTLLSARFVAIEHAIRQFRLRELKEVPTYEGPDPYQIIQVHSLEKCSILDLKLRRKLHHISDMRGILDTFYPGFFGQTHIVGLNKTSNFLVAKFLAREKSSSKWRRQWHLSHHLSEVEKQSTHIITRSRRDLARQSFAASEHSALTPAQTSLASTRVQMALARGEKHSPGEGKERIQAARRRNSAPQFFHELIPERVSWYKRTLKRIGSEPMERLTASGSYVTEGELIWLTEGPGESAGEDSSQDAGTGPDHNRGPSPESCGSRGAKESDSSEDIIIQLDTGETLGSETQRRRKLTTKGLPAYLEPSKMPGTPTFSISSSDSSRTKRQKGVQLWIEKATRMRHIKDALARLEGRPDPSHHHPVPMPRGRSV
ncbi:hypothetical protein BT67DRAFT_456684 [Trichocladium antarcticum]|uniref:Phosphatidylinositol transfer protein SFH5 n=1 Tax=Trichocladium antarcticum TaxID=1450529 RepID=A0AAN6UIP1_9PEZI|nr:hypothetical protein BT67DRAFT_456684 [Trichocladium antarcticum]